MEHGKKILNRYPSHSNQRSVTISGCGCRRNWPMRYALLIAFLCGLPLRANDLGLKAPPGFKVTLWADHTLANDIYTMCLDEKGRVVVSGPGYIRRLEDTDGDGKADKATDIAETKTGAMGLLFRYQYANSGSDLYAAADGKIRRCSAMHDPKRLVEYDEGPLKLFPLGEHGGHSLKIGPDGSLYAVAGNSSALTEFPRIDSSII